MVLGIFHSEAHNLHKNKGEEVSRSKTDDKGRVRYVSKDFDDWLTQFAKKNRISKKNGTKKVVQIINIQSDALRKMNRRIMEKQKYKEDEWKELEFKL